MIFCYVPHSPSFIAGGRIDQEIWNLVGNDPGVLRFESLLKDIDFHLSDESVENFENIWVEYEESLYDKLAAKHRKPSLQYRAGCKAA